MRIPQKQKSLAAETYQVLRESIEQGVWGKNLPGERVLCSQYLISRPTLRKALNRLETEGFIGNAHGRHRVILFKQNSRRKQRKERAVIGLLSPLSAKDMIGTTSRKVAAISNLIFQKQMDFKLVVKPKCYNKSPHRSLKALVEEHPCDCWILQQTNQEMQQWFESNRIHAIVSGTRFEGTNLPFVDLDNKAICRHAVGLLLGRGRHHLCFVRHDRKLPGDQLSESGFLDATRNSEATHSILTHNNDMKMLRIKLEERIAANPKLDAFLANDPTAAFCILTHLLRMGFKIPEDFAIVSRIEARYFHFTSPTMAYYTRPHEAMAKRLADLAIKLSQHETLVRRDHFLIPDFIPGESLG